MNQEQGQSISEEHATAFRAGNEFAWIAITAPPDTEVNWQPLDAPPFNIDKLEDLPISDDGYWFVGHVGPQIIYGYRSDSVRRICFATEELVNQWCRATWSHWVVTIGETVAARSLLCIKVQQGTSGAKLEDDIGLRLLALDGEEHYAQLARRRLWRVGVSIGSKPWELLYGYLAAKRYAVPFEDVAFKSVPQKPYEPAVYDIDILTRKRACLQLSRIAPEEHLKSAFRAPDGHVIALTFTGNRIDLGTEQSLSELLPAERQANLYAEDIPIGIHMSTGKVHDYIMAMFIAEGEATGAGWVHPGDINAHVNSNMGSDMWHVESEADVGAIFRIYDRLMLEYLQKEPELSETVARAADRLEKSPTIEALIELAEVILSELR